MIRRLAVVTALLLGSLGFAPLTPASATGFTVNSSADTSDANPGNGVCATATSVCTLRAAVQEANALGGSDVITVPAMTITLASQLPITSSLTLQGAGARATILAASATPHGMIKVTAGVVTVSGLTITGATGGGGALAVWQEGGTLTLDRIRVTGNHASGAGAAYGPVYLNGGVMTLRDSEISGNTTTSTSSGGWSGALSVYSGTVAVVNSTLAGNSVNGSDWAFGGGVWAGMNGVVTITSSTIADNTVSATNRRGAGVFQHTGGSGSIELQDSIIAEPHGMTNCSSGGVLPFFLGKNLIDDPSCGAASATRTIAAANLGPLADNGGPTNTRVPAAGSPAIDAASACATPTDQRGQARPIGAKCDLGAVEVGSDLEVAVAVSNPNPSGGSDIVVTATVRNKGADRSTGTTVSVQAAGAAQILSASVAGGTCNTSGDTTTCSLGSLPAGSAADVVMSVRMPAAGSVTATATASSQQPDPLTGNNSASATATVPGGSPPPAGTCSVTRAGTGKADVLRGTAASDRILGKAGNDRINGKAGRDCLLGGAGKDRITGGSETDRISAGKGNDTVLAKDGAKDRVNCGPGRDTVIADQKDVLSRCEVVRRR